MKENSMSNIIPFDGREWHSDEELMRYLNEYMHSHSIEEMAALSHGSNRRHRVLIKAIALLITGRELSDAALRATKLR